MITDALIIKKKWLDLIFDGRKTWELRGSRTYKRGKIGLIESGSGQIKGICELVDCISPISHKEFLENKDKHFSDSSSYKKTFAWVIKNAKRYASPVFYKHPQGAIIWVKV